MTPFEHIVAEHGPTTVEVYGRLDCPSALRALARGGYTPQRVFFANAATARAAGRLSGVGVRTW